MIILLFKLILITSILVLGYTIVTQEGNALYSLRKWAEKKKDEGKKWAEPLFICHWCQPSSFTFMAFAFTFGLGIIDKFEWNFIFLYILTVGCSSLFCGLTWAIYETINRIKDRNEAEEDFYRISIEDFIERSDNDFDEEDKKKEWFEQLKN